MFNSGCFFIKHLVAGEVMFNNVNWSYDILVD